jgi:hypothetical protein
MAKRRYSRKRTKRKKTKRRVKRNKRKTRRRKKRRKQRGGGSGCPYNKNMGEFFTLRKYNTNPILPDPRSTNLSSDVPFPYRKSGGKRKRRTKRKTQKGGSWYEFGLSDVINSYFDGVKSMTDIPLKYRGKKQDLFSDPMKQKVKTPRIQHTIPDVDAHHRRGITQAANYGSVGAGEIPGA